MHDPYLPSARLMYAPDPVSFKMPKFDNIDRCTELVMQYREDQLLSGIDSQKHQDLADMEEIGFIVEDAYELDEE